MAETTARTWTQAEIDKFFADQRHRITAAQKRGLTEIMFPVELLAALLAEHDRPTPTELTCEDRSMQYADFPLDVVLPDAQWLAIHPEGAGGVLCSRCIIKRAARLPKAIIVSLYIVRDDEHDIFRRFKNRTLMDLDRLENAWDEATDKLLEASAPAAQPASYTHVEMLKRHREILVSLGAVSVLKFVDQAIAEAEPPATPMKDGNA